VVSWSEEDSIKIVSLTKWVVSGRVDRTPVQFPSGSYFRYGMHFMNSRDVVRVGVVLALMGCVCAQASDGFTVRHNLSGTLGSELFNPGSSPGWRWGLAYGETSIDKVTGGDGEPLRIVVPGGAAPLPGSLPSSQYPTYGAQSVGVASSGKQQIYSLSLTHATAAVYSGGQIEWSLILPYGKKTQQVRPVSTTPALSWPTPSALNTLQQAGVTAQFAQNYQAQLDQLAAHETGSTTGLGDAEITLNWVKDTPTSRLMAGVGLIVPTGRYDTSGGPQMSSGNFYTLKPSIVYVHRWGDVSAGLRAALGLNTRNRDNQVRSGNFAGLELAAGTLTRVGSFGVHLMRAQQIQDDAGGTWGTNRFASTTFGWSFATKIPGLGLGLSLQRMRTLESSNAQSGAYTQVKVSRSF
jgi:hypothetical protein